MSAAPTSEAIDAATDLIEQWIEVQRHDNPAVAHVERDETGERRWFVRLNGEEKSVFSVWFHLRQRSLWVETYFMPTPIESPAQTYEHLLRRNSKLVGFAFVIGDEDAVFLQASLPVERVDADELDRLLGSAYAYTEAFFRPAMRIGFGDRFKG